MLFQLLNPNPSRMSFSADSSGLHRKCTTSERAANNADPLVTRKKAHEAQKKDVMAMPVAVNAGPAPKNGHKTPDVS
jgi:hypothetical protein